MEGFLNVPGAGGRRAVGEIAHNVALGRGQIHFFQRLCDGLVSAPVQDSGLVAIMHTQFDHLQIGSVLKCSLLLISLP